MSGTTYPNTPPGWTPVASRSIGPFTTHVTFQQADGSTVAWSSRSHRKHASLLSRVRRRRERVHRAARHASWWIGILFAAGSVCFLVASTLAWFEVATDDLSHNIAGFPPRERALPGATVQRRHVV